MPAGNRFSIRTSLRFPGWIITLILLVNGIIQNAVSISYRRRAIQLTGAVMGISRINISFVESRDDLRKYLQDEVHDKDLNEFINLFEAELRRCSSLSQYWTTYITERCYTLTPEKLAWSAARQTCEDRGGILWSVTDNQLYNFLTAKRFHLGSILFRPPYNVWAGAGQNDFNNWIDGSPILLDDWDAARKLMSRLKNSLTTRVTCLAVKGTGMGTAYWEEESCDDQLFSICQHDADPLSTDTNMETEDDGCPSYDFPVKRFRDQCYSFDINNKNCTPPDEGISIDSREKMNFFAENLHSLVPPDQCYHLPLEKSEGKWRWKYTGEDLTFSYWDEGNAALRFQHLAEFRHSFGVPIAAKSCPPEWLWIQVPSEHIPSAILWEICLLGSARHKPSEELDTTTPHLPTPAAATTIPPEAADIHVQAEKVRPSVTTIVGKGVFINGVPTWKKSAHTSTSCARMCRKDVKGCLYMDFNQQRRICRGFASANSLKLLKPREGWAVWKKVY